MDTKNIDENKNPFPIGTVAWSKWESEREREYKHLRTIALLEGRLPVVDEFDIAYLNTMGGTRGDRAGWPKRWCTCNRCHSDWQATGFPAPSREAKYQFSFALNRFGDWLFPSVCDFCADELAAIKPPFKVLEKPKSNARADLDL